MDKKAKTTGGYAVNKRRSLQQYRAVDLALWSVMLLVFESIIIMASVRWFPAQPYTVSLVPAVIAAVLVRWGPWAAVQAVLGGCIACMLQGASAAQYAVYCIGNLFFFFLLPLLAKRREREKPFRDFTGVLGFGLAVLLLIQTGRALVSLILGGGMQTAVRCYTTEAVTDLLTMVILWIISRLDGMLEDQPHYIRRIQAEENR